VSRVLVTGGAGFIGSHLVDALLDEGERVRVLDNLDPLAHADGAPPHLSPEAELVVGDLRDRDSVDRALGGVDRVFHLGGVVGNGESMINVRRAVDANAGGTATLLEAALERRDRIRRLVAASSMVVYGEGSYRCERHGDVRPAPRDGDDLAAGRFDPPCPVCDAPLAWAPVGEDAPTDPRNVYAATKLHQEHLCALYGREHGTVVTALRYHNVYGPRMPRDTPYAGVASIFRSAVARGEPPTVLEDGRQTRDFVHVRDVARANAAALTADEPVPGPLNVASGRPRTVLDLARAMCAGTGLAPRVVGGGRLGDVRHIVASPERAATRLGFRAVEPFTAAALAG
jgi:dTDP-L-rhamnose 4-epimerase